MELNQLDMDRARRYARAFAASTGIACTARELYEDGAGADSCESAFCRQLGYLRGGSMPCGSICAYAASEARRFGGQYIFACENGLYHFIAPIVVGEETAGYLLGGPVLMTDRDDFLAEETAGFSGFTPEQQRMLSERLDQIPWVSPERLRGLADLLQIAAEQLGGVSQIETSRELMHQQQDISSYIHTIKRAGEPGDYPLQTERELCAAIENGDPDTARRLLNEILGYIYFSTGNDLETIKARVTELVVMLSRSAMSAGVNTSVIFGMNYHYIREINSFGNIEQLSRWLTQAMNRFSNRVIEVSSNRAGALERALKFIRANLTRKITLEETAAQVYLTPPYFSHIFKVQMGCTFSKYLCTLRVDHAKKLLLDDSLSLVDVVELSGFSDQSYFTKVFKAQTGVTPKKYKNLKGKLMKEASG